MTIEIIYLLPPREQFASNHYRHFQSHLLQVKQSEYFPFLLNTACFIFVHVFVFRSVICLSVCLSACVSVCLSVCLSVCSSSCLSISHLVYFPNNCHEIVSIFQIDFSEYQNEVLFIVISIFSSYKTLNDEIKQSVSTKRKFDLIKRQIYC